jgi:hypothetical protein
MKAISPFKILDDFFRLYVAESPPTVNNEFSNICYVTATKFNVIQRAVSKN